ncbi:MAG: glycosyltransferase, partial [Actinomycetota bacterium]
KGPLKVIMVSRLLRDKGVFEFIEAAKKVHATNPTVQFILAGDVDDGNPTSLTRNEIQKLSSSGVVEFLGSRTDIAELLSASHIACLPSYREGLPKSLIEATAAGRPIVTTDVTGCREVVTDQVNGLLVPPRDGGALAAALLKLIHDPEMRKVMGARNREKAEKEFANEIIIDQTLKVYESFYAS